MIRQAVHNHFAHRAELTNLEFRALMKQGRLSLLIGLSCLAVSLVISKVLLGAETGTWAYVVRESLTIAGWVAMWQPDADLSLRLVALASAQPPFRKAKPHSGASRSQGEERDRLMKGVGPVPRAPSAVLTMTVSHPFLPQ